MAALLTTGIQSGWSNRDFFEGIHSIVRKTAVQRQPLFLHNFVGMLVSTTAKDFMLNIGMKEYMWVTMRDEKVRGNPAGKYPDAVPSHWIIDSKICSWKDASIFSDDGRIFRNRTLMMPKVHPGMEINCRCAAAPFWGNLNREADIRKEEV